MATAQRVRAYNHREPTPSAWNHGEPTPIAGNHSATTGNQPSVQVTTVQPQATSSQCREPTFSTGKLGSRTRYSANYFFTQLKSKRSYVYTVFPLSVLIIPTTGVLASQQICSLVAWHSSITRQYIRIRHCKWEFSVVGVSSCQMCPLSTLPNTAVNYTQHSCELYSTRL